MLLLNREIPFVFSFSFSLFFSWLLLIFSLLLLSDDLKREFVVLFVSWENNLFCLLSLILNKDVFWVLFVDWVVVLFKNVEFSLFLGSVDNFSNIFVELFVDWVAFNNDEFSLFLSLVDEALNNVVLFVDWVVFNNDGFSLFLALVDEALNNGALFVEVDLLFNTLVWLFDWL